MGVPVAAVPVPSHSWPSTGVVTPHGVAAESTCYGCRPHVLVGLGKRSAEPSPDGIVPVAPLPPYGVALHPSGGHSYVGPTVFGYPHVHKRSAEPSPHGVVPLIPAPVHVPGEALHPGGGHSYVGPTVFGYPHIHGKRSADPHGVVPAVVHPVPVAAVPVPSHSWPSTGVVTPHGVAAESTCYGCRPHVLVGLGKRSAEPSPDGVVPVAPLPAYGVALHPSGGHSYVGPTVLGYPHVHKRSAEPSPHGVVPVVGLGPVVGVHHPTGHSFQSGSNVVGAGLGLTGIAGFHRHPLHLLGKRSAQPQLVHDHLPRGHGYLAAGHSHLHSLPPPLVHPIVSVPVHPVLHHHG